MKVKNIVFSGFMAAILMGATATAANAAISVASKDYVDTKSAAIATATINTEMADTGAIGSKIKAADDKAAAAQTAVDTLAGNVYTKTQADELLAKKADLENVYLKTQTYTQQEVQDKIDETLTGISGGTINLTGYAKTEDVQAAEAAAKKYTDDEIAELTAEGGAIKALQDKVGETSVADSIAASLAAYSTTAQVDAKDAATLQSAKDYADGLASNYDAAGAANQALTDAKAYADGLATNYDAAGAANQALTDAKAYADGLATNYDASGSAAQALTDAKAYADGLATNYDAAGAAAAAQTAAEATAKTYTDTELAKYTTTEGLNTKLADYALQSALTAEETARKAADEAATAAVATKADISTVSALDGRVTANESAISTNTQGIADINEALTTKIPMPEVCNTATCVLTYDNETSAPVWVPLTDPVADFM